MTVALVLLAWFVASELVCAWMNRLQDPMNFGTRLRDECGCLVAGAFVLAVSVLIAPRIIVRYLFRR